MRLVEIANADEQMALWKLISDNVWAAINQQARAEAERKAAEQRTTKLQRGKRSAKGAAPMSTAPPPKKATPPMPTQQKKMVGGQQQQSAKVTAPTNTARPTQPTPPLKPLPTKPTAAVPLHPLQKQPQSLPLKVRKRT